MDYNELATVGTQMGCLLIQYGAEIYRAEESMTRLFTAYGAEDSQVFALTTCINVTVCRPDGVPFTRIRRINDHCFDLEKIDQLNDLCRRACTMYIPLWKLQREMKRIETSRVFSRPVQALSWAALALTFTLFYGGGPLDAVISAVTGFAVFGIDRFLSTYRTNLFFLTILQSAAIGVICLGANHVVPGLHVDVMIIGAVMNLVPGTAITSFMRDLLAGDYLSGTLRFMESMIVAGAIALGVGIVLFLTRILWGV
jgi:uncharacterized membrane protein YjjP (DUF1212 family)